MNIHIAPPMTFTLETKVVGRRTPFERRAWTVPHVLGTAPTLRDVLSALVRDEVAAYNARQQSATLRFLTSRALTAAAEIGKVTFAPQVSGRAVDAEDAIAVALQAFDDGLYYVFVDDVQIEQLTTRLTLQPNSTLLLLRLTALAGG